MQKPYGEKFFSDLEATQVPSAHAIVPFLCEILRPKSVVDIGCGRGFWLAAFSRNGAERVFGLDGPWVPIDQLAFPEARFKSCDFNAPIVLGEAFDIAICLEVAEHLPPYRAKGFVEDICKLAPSVLFGAAVPGQGGLNHFNEQWPAYWAGLFEENSYVVYDIVRPQFWSSAEVTWWYKQNTVLYVHRDAVSANVGLSSYQCSRADGLAALVHPELFRQKIKEAEPGFGQWIRSGKRALLKSLGKRF